MTDQTSQPLLSARRMSVTLDIDGRSVRVLDDATLDIDRSSVTDIVGQSGVGKSTLLRVLARLLPSANADLRLDGMPAEDIAPTRWRSLVTLVPQKPAIAEGSVSQNLLLPWRLRLRHGDPPPDAEALASAMAGVGLGGVGLDRDAARLSVGQQARVALLRVVLSSPRVLLLDEVDANLDDESAATVSDIVARFSRDGGAVVRVRHRGSDGLASRRLRLEAGVLGESALR